jgi:Fe-S-cluster containining protein
MTEVPVAFGTWLSGLGAALRGEVDSDVPCGTCVACCSSSQFVHIEPDEADALAHIPAELLFPAPGMPTGHVLMGYDAKGRCPLLTEAGCSIYAHRPRTCRTYDCRVFPAARVFPDEPQKAAIAERAAQWRFTYGSAAEREQHEAVQATAARLRIEHPDVPATPLAVRSCRAATGDSPVEP